MTPRFVLKWCYACIDSVTETRFEEKGRPYHILCYRFSGETCGKTPSCKHRIEEESEGQRDEPIPYPSQGVLYKPRRERG
jgi:hypothetical protein